MGTIVIHAGMPKAGSSSIQEWLRRNGSPLLRRSDVRLVNTVFHAGDERLDVVPRTSWTFAADDLATVYRRARRARQGILRDLVAGLGRQAERHRVVVLSGEAIAHLFWLVDEPFLASLEELAATHRVRVAYYVRPQHEALESAWKQWGFRSGRSPSEYLEDRAHGLHYGRTLAEVAARASHVAFEPRPFRADLLTEGSVTADFARHFLGLTGDLAQTDRTWANRGLPLELANLLRAAPAGLFWDDVHDNAGLDAIKRLIGDRPFPEAGEMRRSRALLQAWCHRRFEAENRELIAALGWPTEELVPAPEIGLEGEGEELREIDALWRPKASPAELELLWHALSDSVLAGAGGEAGDGARQGAAKNWRRGYTARPPFRGGRLVIDLELGVGRLPAPRPRPRGPLGSLADRPARPPG